MKRAQFYTVIGMSVSLGACFGGPPAEPDAETLRAALARGTAETGPLDENTTLASFEKQSCDLKDESTYDCKLFVVLENGFGRHQLAVIGTFTYENSIWQLVDLQMQNQ